MMFPWSAVILQLLVLNEFSEVFRSSTLIFADGMWYAVFDTRGEVCLGRNDNSTLPGRKERREHSFDSVQLDYPIYSSFTPRLLDVSDLASHCFVLRQEAIEDFVR